MIKRVNFTGRKRIASRCVECAVHDGTPRTFDVKLDLGELEFPPDALVFVEVMAAGSPTVQRFDFGTVGRIEPPGLRQLDWIDGENVFFAVKVVDRASQRILGLAKHVRPLRGGVQTATGRKGILPIVAAPLGQQLWNLDFGTSDVCLQVNEELAGLEQRVRADPTIFAILFPAVVRLILERAINEGDLEEPDDRWPYLWLRFGSRLHPDGEPPPKRDDEEGREWIDAVVKAFAEKHRLKEVFGATSPALEDEEP